MKKLFIIIILSILFISDSENGFAEQTIEIKPMNEVAEKKMGLQPFHPILPKSALLDVPLFNQMDSPMLFNGCEVTSLAMILNYAGVRVTKNELASKIKKVPLNYGDGLKGNPNAGFVGNMETGPGLSVFNGPIYNLAREYVGNRAENLTNSSFTDLLKMVSQGQPVWIITTTDFTPVSSFQEWNTPQGKVKITLSGHSVVITGYDEKYIYINDPYGYKNRKVEREKFMKTWEQMGSQAIIIKK